MLDKLEKAILTVIVLWMLWNVALYIACEDIELMLAGLVMFLIAFFTTIAIGIGTRRL